jgi:hypothetical protein
MVAARYTAEIGDIHIDKVADPPRNISISEFQYICRMSQFTPVADPDCIEIDQIRYPWNIT